MRQRCVPLTCAVLVLLVIVLFSWPRAKEPSAQIIEFGRYKCKIAAVKPTTDSTSGGAWTEVSEVAHVEATRTIPCRIGESFGFLPRFSDLPRDRIYILREETAHPPIAQPNGEILTKSVRERRVHPGEEIEGWNLWTFTADSEYELVPGKWTHSIYVDDKEVAAMTFDVVK